MQKNKISAFITADGELIDITGEGKRVIIAEKDERIITKKQIEHITRMDLRQQNKILELFLTESMMVRLQS